MSALGIAKSVARRCSNVNRDPPAVHHFFGSFARLFAGVSDPRGPAVITYPLTARRCVQRIITDLGVFDCAGDWFAVVELAPEVTLEQVVAATGAPVR